MVIRKRIDGDEQDALSRRARGFYSWRPGAIRKIKRKANKRYRREGRAEAKREVSA